MNVPALQSFFAEQAVTKQKFGTVDCVNFVTQAVYLGWDRDYRDVLQYSDRRSAVQRLRQLGGLKRACIHAMGEMHPIDELEVGDVIWFDKPATIGLLMDGYVAVKGGKTIHRLKIEPQMMGWKTSGR